MGWRKIFGKKGREGSRTRDAGPKPLAPADGRASQPLSGYGSNPYDTYTWQLHTEPNGDRELKRTQGIDRPRTDDESFNPYDTGKFSGGW